MKCISRMTISVPCILHNLHLRMLKHLMDWVTSFLEQHSKIGKLNQLWAMMPPYSGFAWFNKLFSLVMQWSETEIILLPCVIVPGFAVTLSNHVASQRFPAQKPCCMWRTQCMFNSRHSTGTILKPQSRTWRSIWRCFIVKRMCSVDSATIHPQSRSRKPRKSSFPWTTRRNRRVTPLGSIF